MNGRSRTVLALMAMILAAPAWAEDPPARVARLSYVSGSVSFRPANLEEWAGASLNRPLTTGDHLWTEKGARGELHVGTMVIRLGPETAFAFLNLDDRVVQMQVTQGSASIHLRGVPEGESFEMDTPNAAVSLLHPGTYRVDVSADGDSTVSVRHGDAAATAEGSEVPVHERQVGVFTGEHPPIYDIQEESSPDDWDRWVADRERGDDAPRVSRRYVSAEVVGSDDLDTYGQWRTVPDYGPVWTPSSAGASWVPYREGHWGFVAPWGWTWIDDEPWGFAPFHYGRWAYVGGGWGWCPGTLVARPVYAPALVAFVGGGGWSASLSIGVGGGVAWFPLGPREAYYPSYAVSPAYVQNVNVAHVVNVTNINVTNVNTRNVTYVNQSVAGAVTAVPQSTFVSAGGVAAAAVAVPVSVVASARASSAPLGVQPTAQSVLSRPAPAAGTIVPSPPSAVASRAVVARLTPPPPPPAFGAGSSARLVASPLIKPAIPPAGTQALSMRPARATLPAPRIATAPLAVVPPAGTGPKAAPLAVVPPAAGTSVKAAPNDRPSRAPARNPAASGGASPAPAGTAASATRPLGGPLRNAVPASPSGGTRPAGPKTGSAASGLAAGTQAGTHPSGTASPAPQSVGSTRPPGATVRAGSKTPTTGATAATSSGNAHPGASPHPTGGSSPPPPKPAGPAGPAHPQPAPVHATPPPQRPAHVAPPPPAAPPPKPTPKPSPHA